MYFNSLFLNPLYDAAREYYLQLNPPVEAIKKQIYPYLAIPHPKAPIKRKNIVYIFLESFDRAYTDERNFAKLTPHLNALKNRIDFSEIHQVVDTGLLLKGCLVHTVLQIIRLHLPKIWLLKISLKILSALAKFYTLWDTIPIL